MENNVSNKKMWVGFVLLSSLFLSFIVFLTLVYARDPLEAHLFFFLLLFFSALGAALLGYGIYALKKKTRSKPIGIALLICGLFLLYPPLSRDLSQKLVSLWFPEFEKVQTGVSTLDRSQ